MGKIVNNMLSMLGIAKKQGFKEKDLIFKMNENSLDLYSKEISIHNDIKPTSAFGIEIYVSKIIDNGVIYLQQKNEFYQIKTNKNGEFCGCDTDNIYKGIGIDNPTYKLDVGNYIPELKGVLMDVSDEEDFENTSQELIIGTLNGLFISNTLESWEYARPIKEIKEAWVNVYENNSGEVVVSQYSFNTRQEAILNNTYLNFKYIKTIKITNEKDGE